MDWKTIKEIRFELEDRGFFVETFNENCFIVSKLNENNGKLYYVYPNVKENGKLKVFDLNIKSI